MFFIIAKYGLSQIFRMRYDMLGHADSSPKSGRSRTTSEEETEQIMNSISRCGLKNSRQIRNELNLTCSEWTVRRLHENGYHHYIPAQKEKLNAYHKQQRLAFALEHGRMNGWTLFSRMRKHFLLMNLEEWHCGEREVPGCGGKCSFPWTMWTHHVSILGMYDLAWPWTACSNNVAHGYRGIYPHIIWRDDAIRHWKFSWHAGKFRSTQFRSASSENCPELTGWTTQP